MTREEMVLLCRYVRACCPQQHMDEYTPDAWHDILGDVPLDFAKAAVVRICRRQPWVAPAEILAEARLIRDEVQPSRPALEAVPDEDPRPRAEIEATNARGLASVRKILGDVMADLRRREGRDAS